MLGSRISKISQGDSEVHPGLRTTGAEKKKKEGFGAWSVFRLTDSDTRGLMLPPWGASCCDQA